MGETEHKLREVFKKARDKASEDVPVVIFFDEMDSLFRMRGSGISSDMEATVVAQFLSEIDGVESLKNVIVIGASNRQDLIDPAVLRPGRLDLKIKVHRPDAAAAKEIFLKYLTTDLPFHATAEEMYGSDPTKVVEGMISDTIERMYTTNEDNKFLEVTYAKGEREIFYFKDFSSGAMIENIVSRAKKRAVKRTIEHERARHHARRPDRVGERRVQGERGSPEHDEPRRLGAHLRAQGRAHHQRANAHDGHQPEREVD